MTDVTNYIDLHRLVKEMCNVSGIDLLSTTRKRRVVIPRQAAMYSIRNILHYTYAEIGMAFNGKDHATVVHACKVTHASFSHRDEASIRAVNYVETFSSLCKLYAKDIPKKSETQGEIYERAAAIQKLIKKHSDLENMRWEIERLTSDAAVLKHENSNLSRMVSSLEREVERKNVLIDKIRNRGAFTEKNIYSPRSLTAEQSELQRLKKLEEELNVS
jgi:hypothetical protein